jgi:coenzyme F420 hydrogenase subunit beta
VVRRIAASGGCASALLVYGLETGIIDGAIVAGMSEKHPWRAEPRLATTKTEVLEAAQSKYTVVPNNAMLSEAKRKGIMKLGIVGLPCHIHGIRKIQMHRRPKEVSTQIKFAIGIFCGSNWSYRATEYSIAKSTGIPLRSIKKFEYRAGPESLDTQITLRDEKTIIIPREARASVMRRMQRDRCTMCLDFAAEIADVSLGDIFLPVGSVILPNLSAIIVRTKHGETLINGAERNGYVSTSHLEESGFCHNVGFENKRYFAPNRITERKRFGWPTPDYYYEPKDELPAFADEKVAMLQQTRDIPEVVEWITQNPRYQQKLAEVDPELLKALGQLHHREKDK